MALNSKNPYSSPPSLPSPLLDAAKIRAAEIPFETRTSVFALVVFVITAMAFLIVAATVWQNGHATATISWFSILTAGASLSGSGYLLGLALQKQTFDQEGIHTSIGAWKIFHTPWQNIHSWNQTFPDEWVSYRKTNGRLHYLNSLGSRRHNPKVGAIEFRLSKDRLLDINALRRNGELRSPSLQSMEISK